MLTVKYILEDDYGCEELQPGEKRKAIVILTDENGREIQRRFDDDWLYEQGIEEGKIFPFEITDDG